MDDKIAALGEITLESKEAIEAAREAYNALSDAAKAKVTNLNTLIAAEKALADLQKPEPPKPILPVVPVAPVEDFIDVPAHAWCYDSVRKAVENGLIDGMGNGKFDLDGQLTVAQAIKLAAALHEMHETGRVTLK